MKLNITYLLVFCVFFLGSCSKHSFEEQPQNPLPFTKTISIEQIKTLYKGTPLVLSEALYTQGVIIGADATGFYLQDEAGSGIRIGKRNAGPLERGQVIKAKIGGNTLSKTDNLFHLDQVDSLEELTQGNATTLSLTIEEIEMDPAAFASSLVTVADVTIQNPVETDQGTRYELVQGERTIFSLLADDATYTLPEEAAAITGILTFIGSDWYLNTRDIEDIQEVAPPPTLFEQIVMNSGLVNTVIFNSEVTLSSGVKLVQGQYINNASLLTAFTLFEVDLKVEGTSLEVGLANNGDVITNRHSLVNMARTKDAALATSGWEVLGGITGDFWTTSPVAPQRRYEPFGPVIKRGQTLKTGFYDNREFFGLLQDGTPVIGGKARFDALQSDLKDALGGRQILENGEIVNVISARDARPAIGYTADNKVYLFVGDGRQPDWSNGYNTEEIAKLLSALGVTDAVYLNGGDYGMAVGKNMSNNTINNVSRPSWNHDAWISSSWIITSSIDNRNTETETTP